MELKNDTWKSIWTLTSGQNSSKSTQLISIVLYSLFPLLSVVHGEIAIHNVDNGSFIIIYYGQVT